jgi:hypothetical protein
MAKKKCMDIFRRAMAKWQNGKTGIYQQSALPTAGLSACMDGAMAMAGGWLFDTSEGVPRYRDDGFRN